MILSTELQRSTREREAPGDLESILSGIDSLASRPGPRKVTTLKRQVEKLARSNTETYGKIHVKTDGKRLIAAFEIESDSLTKRWFYFEYTLDESGELQLVR